MESEGTDCVCVRACIEWRTAFALTQKFVRAESAGSDKNFNYFISQKMEAPLSDWNHRNLMWAAMEYERNGKEIKPAST